MAIVGALAATGAWLITGISSAGPSNHGPELWAGQWTTSTGGVAWRAFNEQDLRIAKTGKDATELFNKLPCKNGPRFYRGGYTAGDDRGKIMGCGTPTNMRGRWRSNVGGQFQNGSYEIHISSRNPVKFKGTFRQDDGVTGAYTGTWASHFDGDGCCTAKEQEPVLPDALVPINSVSNGCGGGKASLQGSWGDTSTYLDTNDPSGKRYTINFREACKLHDAGYSGAKVRDVLHGSKIVDFFTWTRLEVDVKFLNDMLLLCRQISALAPGALSDCRGTGGKTSFGARTRYNFVRDAGDLFYQERPQLRGFWLNQSDSDAPAWTLVHSVRNVKASWKGGPAHPTLRGEFKGTLISRDDDSIVSGFVTVTEKGKPDIRSRPMRLSWDPDQPDRLVMSGPGGPLTLNRR